MNTIDWTNLRAMIDHYLGLGHLAVNLYFSPDGSLSASITPWAELGEIREGGTVVDIFLNDQDISILEKGERVIIRDDDFIVRIKKESKNDNQ